MYQVSDIGERLQRNLRAVESTATRSATRLQLSGTAVPAFRLRLTAILGAARLVEDILDRGRQ
ncbi:hypothetical protein ACQ5SK_27905 [Bradyrhizobium japonicum]